MRAHSWRRRFDCVEAAAQSILELSAFHPALSASSLFVPEACVAIKCPNCQQTLAIKELKPGRFTPQCPHCKQRFQLVVGDQPGAAPQISRLAFPSSSSGSHAPAANNPAASRAADLEATTEHTAPAQSGGALAAQSEARLGAAAATRAARSAATEATSDFSPAPEEARAAGVGEHSLPSTLGGYQLLRQLGKGGMGEVYLARQVSLDRHVALKTMKPELARDARFLVRFTREAYAAAQLTHHNVVQIYDIGQDRGTHFFSMEFVKGKTLGALVKEQGPLDVELAAGYILQAARGLKFAHDQGMVHRDIKPDNLLLNEHGVVKVADLGLVKAPRQGTDDLAALAAAQAAEKQVQSSAGSQAPGATSGDGEIGTALAASPHVTRAQAAMGTATYMAPEQARDAANVDARADIYSLGCTLYVLITGRPPFEGQTAAEVITKHANEPIVPPELIVSRVPKEISQIILKMTAKRPEDRYQNMGEVIKALEGFLGIEGARSFSPKAQDADTLQQAAEAFYGVALGRVRRAIVWAWMLGLPLIGVLLALVGWWLAAFAAVATMVCTCLVHFIVQGLRERTYLFLKVREFVLGSRWTDWLAGAVSLLLALVLLWAFGVLWVLMVVLLLSVGIGLAFYYLCDRQLAAQRRRPLETVEQMLRSMRLGGVEEEVLQQFVCKYAGEQWEEFFEALFGYEAKLAARERWGKGARGTARPRYAAWREPLLRWMAARQEARRLARERKHLQRIEEQALRAEGMAEDEARRQAAKQAENLVRKVRGRKQLEPEEEVRGRDAVWWIDRIIGPKLRFYLGALLLAGSVLWLWQNKLLTRDVVQQATQAATEAATSGSAEGAGQVRELGKGWWERAKQAQPVSLPFVPEMLCRWVSNFNALLAGLLLVASAFTGEVPKVLLMFTAGWVVFVLQFFGLAWP